MTRLRILMLVLGTHLALLAAVVAVAWFFRDDIAAYVSTHAPAPEEQHLVERAYETSVMRAVEASNPAVVSVIARKDVPIFEQYYEEFMSPFGDIRVPRMRERGTQELEVGGGSGFIVSGDGLVVTNRHVVQDTDATYSILTNDGESYPVSVVARDQVLDIAVLSINAPGPFPALAFGDSDALRAGQSVIAIGNALGEFRNSVSVGVVSGLARSIVAGDGAGMREFLDEVIQTDAAINIGNSGGPLLNTRGEVVGVNVATAIGSDNIGFALPGNVVSRIVASVTEHGRIIWPMIGIRYVPVTASLAETEGLPHEQGILVASNDPGVPAVVPGSPAARAGIQSGDIIVSFDGVTLTERETLARLIRRREVGEMVELRVLRDGEELSVTLELAELAL